MELMKSRNLSFYLCEFLTSRLNLLFFFLVFSVNFSSGLS